jgi:tetratricopeptide (TPR) repeat protein/DNA-binding CsgD family transcriptional regulator
MRLLKAGVLAFVCLGSLLARLEASPRRAVTPSPGDTVQLNQLLKRANRAVAAHPDSALGYAQSALRLARAGSLPRPQAQALEYIGWVHFLRGDYPGSLRIYQRALAVARAIHFDKECAILNADIGQVLQEEGAYPEALENDLLALRYYGRARDSTHLAYSIMSVASVEYGQHHYQQALAYYQQAIRLLRKRPNQDDLNSSYQGLALVYADLGQFRQAETYFRLGLTSFHQYHDRTNEAIALNNLGDIYSKQKHYAQARRYFDRALRLATDNRDESMIAVCSAGLAQVCFEQAQYGPAEGYARRSLAVAERIRAQPVAKAACLVLSEALAAQQQFQPALAFYKQGKSLEDSLYGIKHTAQIEALRNQYQHYRREQEEVTHRERISQLVREQRITHLTLLLLSGVALSLMLLGWLGWRQYRATQQRDEAQLLALQADERVTQLLNAARLQEAEHELGQKNRKLTSLALAAMQKGEFLHEVKERLEVIAGGADEEVRRQLGRLRQSIEQNGSSTKEWEQFRVIFEEVHPTFFAQLRQQFPDVTPNELRLAALLRLNFSSKAMAGLLGISEESVKKARYRLRQKLQLSTPDNLVEFMMGLDAGGEEVKSLTRG